MQTRYSTILYCTVYYLLFAIEHHRATLPRDTAFVLNSGDFGRSTLGHAGRIGWVTTREGASSRQFSGPYSVLKGAISH